MAPQPQRHRRFPSPSALGLPYDGWRPSQVDTILEALDSPKRFIAIQAPTGVGKSVIGTTITALHDGPSAILTATKPLETQYATTFDGDTLVDIRGAGNYECLAARDEFRLEFLGRRIVACDEGPCRVGVSCELKAKGCLYYDAVRRAQSHQTLVTSYAYWVAFHRYGEGLGPRKLLVLDEAHDAHRLLGDQLTINVGKYDGTSTFPNANASRSAWRSWAATELPEMRRRAEVSPQVKDRLRYKTLNDALTLIAKLPDDWIWERNGARMRFAPVVVKDYAEASLFRTIPKVVLMSATLTPQTLAALGLTPDDYLWLSLSSPFPVKRRPIYVYRDKALPLRIDFRMDDGVRSEWLYQIAEFCRLRRDRKGIIPCVSYERQDILARALRDVDGLTVIAPSRQQRLDDIIASWKHAPAGCVLISPSIGTGVDFAYQLAEYIVIPKVPFPDIRSPIAKARAKHDPTYRDEVTLQTLIQNIGRGMRAADDQCEVIIFDEHVRWFLYKHRAIVPAYITESLRVVESQPRPLTKLGPRKETVYGW
jgi:Rad3-related DNA helicase